MFSPPPFDTKNYQVLCLSKESGIILIQHWYPGAVNAIWLPPSMDAVVQIIKQGTLANTLFLHHLILNAIGELAETEGCAGLITKFASEGEASDYFIDKVIDTYLVTAIHDLKRTQREKKKALAVLAKENWIIKRNERRRAELYLGRLKFDEELKRSCSEFYSSLKSIWGFSPVKLHYMK